VARLARLDQVLRDRKLRCFVCGHEADSFWVYGVSAQSEPLCLYCASGLDDKRPDVDGHMPPDLSTDKDVERYASLLQEKGSQEQVLAPPALSKGEQPDGRRMRM
jgi:hypothetical protein